MLGATHEEAHAVKRLICTFVVLLALPGVASGAQTKIRCHHELACIVEVNHHACDRGNARACRIWRRHEPVAHIAGLDGIPGMTAFAWCVAGQESGDGRDVNNGAGDLGWFQFTVGTYGYVLDQLQAHGTDTQGWDRDPLTAPVVEQTAAFDFYEPINPYAWPHSVPACGGP